MFVGSCEPSGASTADAMVDAAVSIVGAVGAVMLRSGALFRSHMSNRSSRYSQALDKISPVVYRDMVV